MATTSPAAIIPCVVPAVAAGADDNTTVCRVPYDGTVLGVAYVPKSVLTGANTDSRTLSVINKGQSGSGTTVPAIKAFTSGVNAPAFDETAITLSATAADLVVAEGDILDWKSLHVGATGLADPGGTVFVSIQRTYA